MKAKRILLFIVIVLLIVAGVIAFLYFKTDIFKTQSQMFWKYANKNMEIIEVFNNQDIQDIRNKRSNKPYKINSTLNIRKGTDSYDIKIDTSAKDSNNVVTDVNLKKNNKDIISFVLAKKSNLIAFMSKELADGFIAIKNNEIQKLAKEAGIEDVSNIPDTINWFSILDLLYIQEIDENYFVETYSKIIEECTSKNNYSEEESKVKIDDTEHLATAYKLVLSENETKAIAKKILTYMKDEDARSINFISSRLKLMNVPKKYTEHDVITGKIEELIEKLDNIETTDEKFIEATVYVENKETIQTNVKIKDGSVIKIIYKKGQKRLYIIQDNPNTELAKSSNPIISYIGNIKEIVISNDIGNDKNSSLIGLTAKFYNGVELEYSSNISIGNSGEASVDFENTPKIVLNELETDKLKATYNMIVYGLGKIYESKKSLLNSNSIFDNNTNNNTTNNTTQTNTTENNVTQQN